MELIDVEEQQQLSREEAAARLRLLADQLARHNEVQFVRGGARFRARVPDDVSFAFEFEIEDGGTEIEIELSW
jgi:amphi-Trp domain-containing protein